MARRTLIDFFEDLGNISGEFLVFDDGYRSWSYSYRDTADRAHAFAARLHAAGITRGQHVIIWSENRPEWIVALWGCLLRGVVLVPIDYRASADFLRRVAGDRRRPRDRRRRRRARPRRHGRAGVEDRRHGLRRAALAAIPAIEHGPDDVAEVIFTSGATSEPKGVVLTHRNILANIVPIEREIAKYRKYARPFMPIRFLNLLPLSHMFGQAMATFVPPLLSGVVVFNRTFAPDEIVAQIRSRRISVLVSVPKILEVLRDYMLHGRAGDRDRPRGQDALDEAVVVLPAGAPHVRPEVLGHGGRRGAARSRRRGVLGPPRISWSCRATA